MEHEYKEKTEVKREKKGFCKEENKPALITVHRCFCGKGEISYMTVPDSNYELLTIHCSKCKEKYGYIERVGDRWKAYLR